jgi:cobalamin biosynthesis Mg chelatase CobN
MLSTSSALESPADSSVTTDPIASPDGSTVNGESPAAVSESQSEADQVSENTTVEPTGLAAEADPNATVYNEPTSEVNDAPVTLETNPSESVAIGQGTSINESETTESTVSAESNSVNNDETVQNNLNEQSPVDQTPPAPVEITQPAPVKKLGFFKKNLGLKIILGVLFLILVVVTIFIISQYKTGQ